MDAPEVQIDLDGWRTSYGTGRFRLQMLMSTLGQGAVGWVVLYAGFGMLGEDHFGVMAPFFLILGLPFALWPIVYWVSQTQHVSITAVAGNITVRRTWLGLIGREGNFEANDWDRDGSDPSMGLTINRLVIPTLGDQHAQQIYQMIMKSAASAPDDLPSAPKALQELVHEAE